jgi:hypothetical protein
LTITIMNEMKRALTALDAERSDDADEKMFGH